MVPPERNAELYVLCSILSVLAAVGVVGNVLILLVYGKRRDRKTTNVFIQALAGLDLSVCLVVLPYTLVYEYRLVTSNVACKICELTRHFNVIMSNLTLVTVAVERYLAICRPTFALTSRFVRNSLATTGVISVLFSAPSSMIFAVVHGDARDIVNSSSSLSNAFVLHTDINATKSILNVAEAYCTFTTSIVGPKLAFAYQLSQVALWFLCTIVISVLYGIIYCAVWKRDKVRVRLVRVRPAVFEVDQDESTCTRLPRVSGTSLTVVEQPGMSTSGDTTNTPSSTAAKLKRSRINVHRKTGTMLFLCTVLYVVTWIPFWLDIFGATNSLVLRHVYLVSSASNPIIYGIVNRNLRKAMFNIIAGRKGDWVK